MQSSCFFGSATDIVTSSPRDARLTAEHRRLRHNLTTLVTADPRLVDLGPDPLVDQLLSSSGFDQRQAFSIRILLARRGDCMPIGVASRTLIIASSRVWHQQFERALLHEVKRNAAKNHVRCVLVPQRALAAPVRLATGKLIAQSRHVNCSASDRLRIIAYLQSVGGWSDLLDCASQIRHADPAGAVLAMVAQGDLSIDRTKPIGPHSRVSCSI